jgi:apolipoprotein N-acyltransferase
MSYSYRIYLACLAVITVALILIWPSAAETILLSALVVAVAVGMAVRFVKAKSGKRARAAFAPVMGAAAVYQDLLLGKPEPTADPTNDDSRPSSSP